MRIGNRWIEDRHYTAPRYGQDRYREWRYTYVRTSEVGQGCATELEQKGKREGQKDLKIRNEQ